MFKPVGLATHYHTVWIYPYWAPSLDHIGTIGAHRFYRWKGQAGRPAAFSARYAGVEPSGARRMRVADASPARAAADPLGRADPIALAEAYEKGRRRALKNAENIGDAPVVDAAPRYAPKVEQRGGDTIYKARNLPAAARSNPNMPIAVAGSKGPTDTSMAIPHTAGIAPQPLANMAVNSRETLISNEGLAALS